MRMRVNEAGQRSAPTGVDRGGVRSKLDGLTQLGTRADEDDLAVAAGDRRVGNDSQPAQVGADAGAVPERRSQLGEVNDGQIGRGHPTSDFRDVRSTRR